MATSVKSGDVFTLFPFSQFATAAALSSTCITASNLVLVVLGIRTKHPLRPQSPAVDWDVVLVLAGPLLVGAMVGPFLSIMLPQLVTQALQACLMFPTSWLLIKKARTAWRADTERLAAEKLAAAAKKVDESPPQSPRSTLFVVNPLTSSMSSIVTTCSLETEPDDSAGSTAGSTAPLRARKSSTVAVDELEALHADVQAVQASDKRVLPPVPVLLATALALSLTATRVGAAFVRCGSVAFWLITVSYVPVAVAGWLVARSRALAKLDVIARAAPHAALLGLPDPFFAGRVAFTPRNTIWLPALSVVAGVLAGMLGIGGAVVMNPICLALGAWLVETRDGEDTTCAPVFSTTHLLLSSSTDMHPRSTIATCQVGLVINTIGAVVTYAASGYLPPSYAVSLGILAALMSSAGIFTSESITRKTGRPSFIVVTVAAVIFFALLVAIALTIFNAVEVATGVIPFVVMGCAIARRIFFR